MRTKSNDERSNFLLEKYAQQPYFCSINDYNIFIDKSVFPSDVSFGTKPLIDAITDVCLEKKIVRALDIGTGCGVLAIHLAKLGVPEVYAVDNHLVAIECAKNNFFNNNVDDIVAFQSDLFSSIPKMEFDLIIFNHPFYPIKSINYFGTGEEGGNVLITRFLNEAEDYSNGIILMPHWSKVDKSHNPKVIASFLNYSVAIRNKVDIGKCDHMFVYELHKLGKI